MDFKVILISGIPATSKSCYCKWLEQQKGFIHLDFDKLLWNKGSMESLALVQILKETGAMGFINAAKKSGKPIAIDWGFPPNNLHHVRELCEAGAEVWWFAGERQIARHKFIERGGGDEKAFDTQMDNIEANLPQINSVIGSNVIETLHADGTYTKPEEIFKHMFPLESEAGRA
jgi:hypothetical protein